MQRCAVPRLITVEGVSAASIFCSALASASGLRVNCAPIASARYSRLRFTAITSSCVTMGAKIQEMIHTTSRIRASWPRSLPPLRPPPPPPPPPHPDPHATAHHATGAVVQQCHRPDQGCQHGHQAHIEVLDVAELVPDDALQLVA